MAKDQKKDPRNGDSKDNPKNKRYRKGSPKRYGSKPNDDKAADDTKFVPGNDFSWWNKIPELMSNSANFKSNYVAGRPISSKLNYVVPGVLGIGLKTCYHPSIAPTDPVNVWARDLYLRMFQKYRPASGYSASDLGITILAELEAIKLIALYERIYGVITRYSKLNVNMPLAEAAAMGLSMADVNTLQGKLSDFRYDLNYLIRKAQRLCVPKDISFVADAISLLGYEYIDHENPRGQVIIFNLENVGLYFDGTLTTGGCIEFNDIDASFPLFDFSQDNMCFALNNVLNNLLGSDSVQRICADLVVWFGEGAMLQIVPIPEDYVVVPAKSDSILHKLHNAETHATKIAGTGLTTGMLLTSWAHAGLTSLDQAAVLNNHYHIYQYLDSIITVGVIKDDTVGTATSTTFNGISGWVSAGSGTVYAADTDAHIIDGYDPEPQPEFVVEGCLLKASYERTASNKAAYVASCVNWIVTGFRLYQMTSSGAVSTASFASYADSTATASSTAGRLCLVDWAPMTYRWSLSGIISEVYGDLDVIIPIYYTELLRVQRTCFLSGIHTDVSAIK